MPFVDTNEVRSLAVILTKCAVRNSQAIGTGIECNNGADEFSC